jgi:tRNA-2-methylthio-N6-dimethylallyladenosine synthase
MGSQSNTDALERIRDMNIRQLNESGKPLQYHILTYGCQMNEHDSEVFAGYLNSLGFVTTGDLNQADLIIFNTCCVRESAEEKIYGKIGSLKPLKATKKDLIIGVCGCMAQKPDEANRIMSRAPFVDFIIGADTMQALPDILLEIYDKRETIVHVSPDEYRDIVEHLPRSRKEHHKAWVAIMHGCDNFCSYCIVPYVRGRERSRQPEDIVTEIEDLCNNGVREVTLLGQNVNSYGHDLREKTDFAELLKKIDSVELIKRIRFMTSHPKDLSSKMVETIATSKNICRHIHLPVQSGSNRILERMNRGYSREEYLGRIAQIREAIPDCSITTDIIVGFPGESDADFEDTLDLAERVRWNAAYTFLYSNRSGTKAAEMEDQIEEAEKKSRLHRLMDLQNAISYEVNQTIVGKSVEVMVDGPSKTDPRVWTSRTSTNHLVLFPKTERETLKPGDLVWVSIDQAKTWTLHGHKI